MTSLHLLDGVVKLLFESIQSNKHAKVVILEEIIHTRQKKEDTTSSFGSFDKPIGLESSEIVTRYLLLGLGLALALLLLLLVD